MSGQLHCTALKEHATMLYWTSELDGLLGSTPAYRQSRDPTCMVKAWSLGFRVD